MLAHMLETCATPRKKLLESLLVKVNDQRLDSRPKGVNVILWHLILENYVPSRVAILFSIILKGETYKIFEEKLQVIKKKITSVLF